MQDAMGILVHHDAITGTSKDYVHLDYTERLLQSMVINEYEYNQLISEIVERQVGLKSNSAWELCTLLATSYLDCPIHQIFDEQEYDPNFVAYVAVHNPSTLDLNSIEFFVPEKANFIVEIFDE